MCRALLHVPSNPTETDNTNHLRINPWLGASWHGWIWSKSCNNMLGKCSMEDATTKASQDYNSEMTDLLCYNSTRTWQDMTKPHATELPTCATANEFSCHFSARDKGPKVHFNLFSTVPHLQGPVLIFKTKTLHIVEGQVPGSTQMEIFGPSKASLLLCCFFCLYLVDNPRRSKKLSKLSRFVTSVY